MFCRVFWSATGEKILVSYTHWLHRLHKGFTVFWSAADEKILASYTAYIRDLQWFWSAAGEKILASYTAYIGIYSDFGAPQARKFWQLTPPTQGILKLFWSAAGEKFFGNLHRLYKGFTLIFGRRRPAKLCNLHRLHKGRSTPFIVLLNTSLQG